MKTTTITSCVLILSFFIFSCQSNSSDKTSGSAASDSINAPSEIDGLKNAMDKMMQEMHQTKSTGNIDVDFALIMKSHHQGAVDMAKHELSWGQDERLKKLAREMLTKQTSEIAALQKYINKHPNPVKEYDPEKKDEGFAKVLHKNMTMMMDMPKMENGSSTDRQFLEMMIPHHQTGVYMAEGFLHYGKDAALKSLADSIIAKQSEEIELLKSLRTEVK